LKAITPKLHLIQSAKHRAFPNALADSQQSKRRGLRIPYATNARGSTTGAASRRLRKINRQFVSAKKSEEKHCFCLVLRLNEPEQPATKGGG